MRYIPFATKFTSGAQVVNGVNGWEDYMVYDAAAKCASKEESTDAFQSFMIRKAEIKERIDAMAHNQVSGPRFMVDAESEYFPWDAADWRI
jgi:hypothetical protein